MNSRMIIFLCALVATSFAFANSDGKQLASQLCADCHMPTSKKRTAPPFFAVVKHVKKNYPDKAQFVQRIVEWVAQPNAEQALMACAVKHHGVMPALNYTDSDVKKIAEYLYTAELTRPGKGKHKGKHIGEKKGKHKGKDKNGHEGGCSGHGKNDKLTLRSEAENIVKRFSGELKPRLKSAIQSGGFERAIEVCAVEAPQIASKLSSETGWLVKRVSLKARNHHTASPDRLERRILQQFDSRQRAGENAAELSFAEMKGKNFRYMKAQPVEALCLNCHGESITPEVSATLTKYYPNDRAIGYSLGQVRGAFSLSKPIKSSATQ